MLWYRYIYTTAELASVAYCFAINPTVHRLTHIHPVCMCWNKIVHCRMSRWQSSAPHLSVSTGLPTMSFAATRNHVEELVWGWGWFRLLQDPIVYIYGFSFFNICSSLSHMHIILTNAYFATVLSFVQSRNKNKILKIIISILLN